jgi:RNA 3'-terminal phosphate cyclase-like protein
VRGRAGAAASVSLLFSRPDDRRSLPPRPFPPAAEVSFLRLLCALSNGAVLRVSDTGTALRYTPGVLRGGALSHDCGAARPLGWFVEGVLPLLPFCGDKAAALTLSGVGGDAGPDWSLDALRGAALPFLARFGAAPALDIVSRGAPPRGGAVVRLTCAAVRELQPISVTDEGLVRRVRGVAFACRVSPQLANRLASAAKPLLLTLLPDVHVFTDAPRGCVCRAAPRSARVAAAPRRPSRRICCAHHSPAGPPRARRRATA